jgi:CRISPR-associated endonuclease/helicase Cas3
MVEGWESEIVVTTFMQLFHSLISNRNRMIRKFNAMVNSIIILDEVQTIPYKYWSLVRKVFLHFARLFNTHFVFMTATQPLIFEEHEIKESVSKNSKKRYLEHLDRIQFVNQAHDPLSMADFKVILRKDMAKFPDDDFLIVLNTINCSIEVFEDIQTYIEEKNLIDVVQLYYLSTNIIPKHRLERIKLIRESKNRKIIVSTQLVEAGVDIDVDRVYRDFAPFDSLNQVAGRCNREFSPGEKGIVTVFRLKEAKEFHTYIYGKGDISVSKTKDLLRDKKELSEKDFLGLGDEYFRRLKEASSDEESEYMIELLSRLNFSTISKEFRLIQCKYPTRDLFIEVDEEAENFWKEYRRACEIKDPFERKYKINRIKKDFYSYVISVPTKNMPGADIEDTSITYINKEQLVSTYNKSTGFIRKDPGQYIF